MQNGFFGVTNNTEIYSRFGIEYKWNKDRSNLLYNVISYNVVQIKQLFKMSDM